MKIAYGSDLHLELDIAKPDLAPVQTADVLVLGGDIWKGRNKLTGRPNIVEYAEECSKILSIPVLIICGNHELYGQEITGFLADCRRFAETSENVFFLENDLLKLGDVRFLGCTLWSDFAMAEKSAPAMDLAREVIHDYRRIKLADPVGEGRYILPEDSRRWNAESRAFLEKWLATDFDGKTVVITHFPPIPMSAPEFADSPLTPYFNNNWTAEIASGALAPDIWISGHTHHMEELTLGRTRVRSSQGGYPGELGPFRWGMIEI